MLVQFGSLTIFDNDNIKSNLDKIGFLDVVKPLSLSWKSNPLKLYSIIFYDLDYPFIEPNNTDSPYIFYFLINIPGMNINKGYPVINYLVPKILINSGDHRFLIDIYEQNNIIPIMSSNIRSRININSLSSTYNLQLVEKANFKVSSILKNIPFLPILPSITLPSHLYGSSTQSTTTLQQPSTTIQPSITIQPPITIQPQQPFTTTPQQPFTTIPQQPFTTTPQQLFTTTPQQPFTTTPRSTDRTKFLIDLLDFYKEKTKTRSEEIILNTYLDIGCGDCEITREVEKVLQISKTYSADVILSPCPSGHVHRQKDLCDFCSNFILVKDNYINLPDNSIDLITAYVSLHHFTNFQAMMREIVRLLRVGGFLFIREHDANSPQLQPYLDMIHLLIDVKKKNKLDPNFVNTYSSFFWSKQNLITALESYGLEFITDITYDINIPNPQHLYHALFILKEKKIINNITPNQAKMIYQVSNNNLILWFKLSKENINLLFKLIRKHFFISNYDIINSSDSDAKLISKILSLKK